MILMDASKQLKIDIINKVERGQISRLNAAKLLKKSKRTIERYIKNYQEQGFQFVVHKNSKRAPVNKKCKETQATSSQTHKREILRSESDALTRKTGQ